MNTADDNSGSTYQEEQGDFASMREGMLDGFVALNRGWVYTYVNAQAELHLGVKREKILGRTVWDCFPELVETEIGRNLRKSVTTGLGTETEEFYAPLERWFEVRATPFPGGLTVYFRDVTVRKNQDRELQASHEALRESGEALRRSEERFRALTEYCSDLVTILAPNGDIIYDSPSVTTLLGFQPEERIGKRVTQFLHPDEIPELYTLWKREVRDHPNKVCATHRLLHADGSWRWTESVGTSQIDNPALGGIVVNTRDITERKQMEDQLVQTAKLAALGELVSGVAHEINNPLSAISGHAQLLMMNPDPTVREDGVVIQEMVQRMSRLIRSLRTFAPTTGDKHDQHRPADLNQIVRSALEVIGGRLGSGDIELTLGLADNLSPVLVNEGEIEQVLINLLVNAEHALRGVDPDRRRVRIITKQRGPEECRNSQRPCCILNVSDSGPGILPEILPRIFEPFYTTKDIGEGTGLGLSISHSIVVSHGGSLTARNGRRSSGAIFTVELPTYPDERAKQELSVANSV